MKEILNICIALVVLCNVCAQSSEEIEGDNFTYPCGSSYDLDCIRTYFTDSGSCEEAHHEDGEPIPDQQQHGYFLKSNLTVLVTKANVTYLNPQIRAFYINEETKNLIFAVEFDGIIMDSEFTHFRFHRVAKEPVTTGDFVNATYPSILTAIIPVGDGMTRESIETASITAYITKTIPEFTIGPRIYLASGTNTIVLQSILAIFLDIPTAVLEAFLTGAPHFFVLYLQKYLCDFGISLNAEGWGNTVKML